MSSSHAAIFGKDTRYAIRPQSSSYEVGRSTAVAVLDSLISPNQVKPDTYDLWADPMSDILCSDVKFSKLTSVSYACSGFLIAPDLLVTAGHCMSNTGIVQNEKEMYCEAYGWLFDYQVQTAGTIQTQQISPDKFYRCKQIVYAVNDQGEPFRDFAIVQLDRPVTDRPFLKISTANLSIQDPVSMIGYPLGGPMTFSGDAIVKHNVSSRESFITNLDAFDGNSGSAVFNSQNEVVGILVGGTPVVSYFDDPLSKACYRYNVCDDNGENCLVPDSAPVPGVNWPYPTAGSQVQRIQSVLDVLKNSKL